MFLSVLLLHNLMCENRSLHVGREERRLTNKTLLHYQPEICICAWINFCQTFSQTDSEVKQNSNAVFNIRF